MKDWRDIHTKEELRERYASYIPALQEIAMAHGYALAVHGSMSRDLDLVAVPWVPKAMVPETLVMALQYGMTGMPNTRAYWKKESRMAKKPHGRIAYVIWIANLSDDFEGTSQGQPRRHAMIDLSIMPRL